MKKFFIAFFVVLFFTSFLNVGEVDAEEITHADNFLTFSSIDGLEIVRFIDEEAGVVCWIFNGRYLRGDLRGGGGVTCLPIDQTSFRRQQRAKEIVSYFVFYNPFSFLVSIERIVSFYRNAFFFLNFLRYFYCYWQKINFLI